MAFDDPLWNEFRPLWGDLLVAGDQVYVTGGYGLFLKQRWLIANPNHPIVIPLDRWLSSTPRVTNDLDILIAPSLLASTEAQSAIVKSLERNNFSVDEKDPRWKFRKQLGLDRQILVEFHAELPESMGQNLRLDKKMRIKHKPSLGEDGVHGRQNPEAASCGVHPFLFEIDGTKISVPNPVTWSVMKLISTRDRRRKSEDNERNETSRSFHRQQAMKHAEDVARVVAMTTRDERDHAPEVVATILDHPCFADAMNVFDEMFRHDGGWGAQIAARSWQADDFNVIRGILGEWFRS